MRMLLTLLLGMTSPAFAQDHGGHGGHPDHQESAAPVDPNANASGPAVPSDHAADAIHDPAEMEKARQALLLETGGMSYGMLLIDRAEVQMRDGADGYRWAAEAWFGGDINRLKLKTEGEGIMGEGLEQAEVQALYSRALDPWWNLQAGVRHDIRPDPSRTYAVLGIEGVAPYWFHVEGMAFLSNKGDIHLRAEASIDQRLTQRLILQPAVEANFALQDVGVLQTGSGLSDFELGMRLRYEIKPEFAPYVGVEWHRKAGDTARFARLAGEDVSGISAVAGVRFWF
ncbi:MAG: copper resistance protein B [Sphingomonadales bacterium]|jgi:copper resistance protein B|nr:copper resistance protein B [Sphingomonadales bacterium]MBK9269082.1 copper resistance protein B [Sphingomonadales bacterium]